MKKRLWLEEARRKAGLKQYELADLAGISRGYYSAIENGIRKTPGEVALKISIILNISMDLFYRDEIQEWVDQRESKKEEVIENA